MRRRVMELDEALTSPKDHLKVARDFRPIFSMTQLVGQPSERNYDWTRTYRPSSDIIGRGLVLRRDNFIWMRVAKQIAFITFHRDRDVRSVRVDTHGEATANYGLAAASITLTAFKVLDQMEVMGDEFDHTIPRDVGGIAMHFVPFEGEVHPEFPDRNFVQ